MSYVRDLGIFQGTVERFLVGKEGVVPWNSALSMNMRGLLNAAWDYNLQKGGVSQFKVCRYDSDERAVVVARPDIFGYMPANSSWSRPS